MITGRLFGSREVIQKLGTMPEQVKGQLRKAVMSAAFVVQAATKADKLSGQVLNVRTGKLRRSINVRGLETATGMYASIGTNVEYARVHEFGFKGAVRVRAHMRRVPGGRKKVQVREHNRQVKLPERSFLRSALRDKRNIVKAKIAKAVAEGIK